MNTKFCDVRGEDSKVKYAIQNSRFVLEPLCNTHALRKPLLYIYDSGAFGKGSSVCHREAV